MKRHDVNCFFQIRRCWHRRQNNGDSFCFLKKNLILIDSLFILIDMFYGEISNLGAVFIFLSSWMPCVLLWMSWKGCLQRHQPETWLYSRRRLRYAQVSRCVSFLCDNICFLALEGSHRGGVNSKSCSKGRTSQLHCSRAGHATRPRRRGRSSHL